MDFEILVKLMIFLFCLASTIWITIYSILGFIELQKVFPTEKKKIIAALWKYVPEIVNYLEQLRKEGKTDLFSIQGLCESKIQELLKAEGININIEEWKSYIEVLVKAAVKRLPKFNNSVKSVDDNGGSTNYKM